VPQVVNLVGWQLAVAKSRELDESSEGAEVVDVWTLVLTDYQTRDQICIAFRRDTRDELVRQLTDGIVLSGGQLPKL
jgi:hypothetical protein